VFLGKSTKIAATRTALQYVPNRLSAGASPPDLTGELTALPHPLAVFRGFTSKDRERERRRGEGRKGVCALP